VPCVCHGYVVVLFVHSVQSACLLVFIAKPGCFTFGQFCFYVIYCFLSLNAGKNIKLHSNCSRSVTLPNRDLLTFVTVMETLFLDNHIERIM
jgi:hypothetical protein